MNKNISIPEQVANVLGAKKMSRKQALKTIKELQKLAISKGIPIVTAKQIIKP